MCFIFTKFTGDVENEGEIVLINLINGIEIEKTDITTGAGGNQILFGVVKGHGMNFRDLGDKVNKIREPVLFIASAPCKSLFFAIAPELQPEINRQCPQQENDEDSHYRSALRRKGKPVPVVKQANIEQKTHDACAGIYFAAQDQSRNTGQHITDNTAAHGSKRAQ